MPDIYVTRHAAERFIERVDPRLTFDQARDAILASAPAITVAASIGCTVIRRTGHKLILDGARIVTVIVPEHPLSGHRDCW